MRRAGKGEKGKERCSAAVSLSRPCQRLLACVNGKVYGSDAEL
jgi:hypothetical protein